MCIRDRLSARDGDGYVFRVDLRLRPNPEVTPIALPVEAAISYYESSALAWERAAFIRARACSGDVALGQGFLDVIKPFIWRRGLDFGAISEIRGMSRRIRDHYAGGQAFGPGFESSPDTMIANVTGRPSMSLPLHWTDDGLPMGMLFTARIGDEASLFRLAAQVEQVMPWAERVAPHAIP